MNVSLEIVDERVLAAVAADELVASIQDVLSDREACSVVLSGGTTPGAIYRNLSRPPRVDEIEWERLAFFWGDERWVPHSSTHSNFRMVSETLFCPLKSKPSKVFEVDTDLASAEDSAAAYQETIRAAGYFTEGLKPYFDIVLLGVGEDGHIASLFPQSSGLNEMEKLCIATSNPESPESLRVSLTLPVILAAERIYVFAKGESKAETIARIFEGDETVEELPARALMNQASGKVSWFIDSLAASQLKEKEKWL